MTETACCWAATSNADSNDSRKDMDQRQLTLGIMAKEVAHLPRLQGLRSFEPQPLQS